MKRLCVGKLPPFLMIQLKRFDFDWNQELSQKFNDYFQFPLELDMFPFTAQGLAAADSLLFQNFFQILILLLSLLILFKL